MLKCFQNYFAVFRFIEGCFKHDDWAMTINKYLETKDIHHLTKQLYGQI